MTKSHSFQATGDDGYMPKLVAHVIQIGRRPTLIELVIPKELTAREFRQKIFDNEWPRQWLETADGDLLNLNHILLLSVLNREPARSLPGGNGAAPNRA
jgi:hypothetical protein